MFNYKGREKRNLEDVSRSETSLTTLRDKLFVGLDDSTRSVLEHDFTNKCS